MLNCCLNRLPAPPQATGDLQPRTSLGRALGSSAWAVVLASLLLSMASCGGGAGTASDSGQAHALDAPGTESPSERIAQQASVDWIKVANEGETFGVPEATTVRYGSGSAWVQRTATGQVPCTNDFFGADPSFGVHKQCELATGAEQAVTVDVARVIKDTPIHPLGLNTNYLLDDDANRPAARTLLSAMESLKVKYLRYPGGEKSDAYLWSVPPFDRARPTLARTGPYEWPSGDRNLVQPDGVTFKVDPLDFDEFMAVAQRAGAEPVLVVSYDGMYKAATPGGTAPTRQQLLDTAREWVRYANVTRKFGVKYWELGNESYLPNSSYNGSTSAEIYAQDLIEFSRVMKAVDPGIQIGAAGGGTAWWQTVLSTASGSIDFLSVHDYPATGWGSYDHYRTQVSDIGSEVQGATYAIETYALPADRARLKIAVTETNAADWSGQWPNVNDLGHGLALFDILGQQMAHPRVLFTQVWNTRWINNSTQPPELWDALTPQNLLNATGQAIAVWGQFLLDQLVSSTSPSVTLKTFAAHSASARKTHVFLINKDTQSTRARVSFAQPPGTAVASRWTFTGTGPGDPQPTFSKADDVPLSLGQAVLTLPPLSVTVLELQSQEIQPTPPAPPTLVSNGSFEAASLGWEDWGSSNPQAGVGASGTYGMVVGTGAGGRGQLLSSVKPGRRYVLAGQGRVGTTGEIGWIGVTFISSSGARSQLALEFKGTTYAQGSLAFTTPADLQSATVWLWKDSGPGGFFYADDVALAEAP